MAELRVFSLSIAEEITAGQPVAPLLIAALERQKERLEAGDVVAVTHKIVSKSEGRAVALGSVTPGPEALSYAQKTGRDARLLEVILSESSAVVRWAPRGPFICRHKLGFVCTNAGVDCSNSGGADTAILLPRQPDVSAGTIRKALEAHYGVPVGVLIADTQGRSFRKGAMGIAIGVSNIRPLYSYIGVPDRDKRSLVSSVEAQADELAAAATLVMGQAAESAPAAVVRGFPRALGAGATAEQLFSAEQDMFLP